jgi:hypothetical protein
LSPMTASMLIKSNVSGHSSIRGCRSSVAFSKPGLEQSGRTRRFGRTLNLVGAPLGGVIDFFAVNLFH